MSESKEKGVDIILAILPDQIKTSDFYYEFKRITLDNKIVSQIILEKTISKTDNIPFVLSNPINADYIVEIDIARDKKKKQSVTVNGESLSKDDFKKILDKFNLKGKKVRLFNNS